MVRQRRRKGRERLLATAGRLFGERGFHATGINEIIAGAGIAKMTLYNNMASKEALIEAVVEHRSRRVLAWMERGADATLAPGQRLLRVFDLFEAWFNEPGFRGCIFAKAAAEYPLHEHPVHRAVAAHKRRVFEFLEELAADAGAAQPATLAEQLLLLLEGATALAQQTGALIAARRARRAAEQLIAAGL